jgi:hypothetical protein
VHCFFCRLARQEVSLPKPSASAGAQVGTVSAISSFFLTGSVVSSANWTVLPKYFSSLTVGLWAISFHVRLGFFCGRRIAMPASETPPSLELKNFVCVAFGLPRVTDQPTMVPSRGTPPGLLALPTLTWKPVVRLTARQGLPGQLATVGGLVVPITPTSVILAGAAAGSASATRTPAAVNVLIPSLMPAL